MTRIEHVHDSRAYFLMRECKKSKSPDCVNLNHAPLAKWTWLQYGPRRFGGPISFIVPHITFNPYVANGGGNTPEHSLLCNFLSQDISHKLTLCTNIFSAG